MSVILITRHNENIYNIKKDATKHIQKVFRKAASTRKIVTSAYIEKYEVKPHATMGKPQVTLPDPCDFLRKNKGFNNKLWSEKTSKIHDAERTLKPREERLKLITTADEAKKYDDERAKAQSVQKNFIRSNIKRVVTMKPKEPEQRIVLERFGESKPLKQGLEPIYIKSDVYGKTPKYLERFIYAMQKRYQQQKDNVGVEQPKCRYITSEEREKLMEGLKQNWEELQKQYQGLPILTDTIPKKMRKSKMEEDLKQLEKDIVLLERHPYIYVYDDEEDLKATKE